MAEELHLGEAMRALHSEFGESFNAGLAQGKEMMASALQERLKLERAQADKLVEALIEARSVRWAGTTTNLPMEQTGMFNVAPARVEAGTWRL